MTARIALKSDVLIVGAGIAGCATALQLARRGKLVTLIERDQAGIRASGVNFGGVRQNGRDLRELPIAMRARAMWDELLAGGGSALCRGLHAGLGKCRGLREATHVAEHIALLDGTEDRCDAGRIGQRRRVLDGHHRRRQLARPDLV
jgi:glycine/D-amino acid oxidase-like deaminating enzyme